MRRTRRSGGLLLCLLLNLLLNPEGAVLAAALLLLHFFLGWPLWPAIAAAAVWILWITVRTLLIGWASACGNAPKPYRANRNPYSAKTGDLCPSERESGDSHST